MNSNSTTQTQQPLAILIMGPFESFELINQESYILTLSDPVDLLNYMI